jgi:hypothetical protein
MIYLSKQIKLTVTIPKTEIAATDYVCFFSNNGNGNVDLNNAFTSKITSRLSGVNYVFVYTFTVKTPATWKFQYKVFDSAGNAGTTSGEFEADVSDLIPAKAPQLRFVSYNSTTKIMGVGI